MDLQGDSFQFNQAFGAHFQLSNEMKQCLENCLQCHKICEQLIPHCLEMGGAHAEKEHIQKLFLCADVCRTSAHFMMWNSQFHHQVCGVCAEVCRECAADCETIAQGDQLIKICADVCKKCADSCSSMAIRH